MGRSRRGSAERARLSSPIPRQRPSSPSRPACGRQTHGKQDVGATVELVVHRFTRQFTAERRVDDDLYCKSKQAFVEEGLVGMIYLISIYLGNCAVTRGEAKIKILAASVNPRERISI